MSVNSRTSVARWWLFAARPLGRRPAKRSGRRPCRPAALAALDDVIADGSRFVIMGGGAGAGKTTVIETFLHDLNGRMSDRKAQVITGQCVPLGGDGLPYAPIVGALHDLVARYGPDQILDWAGAGRTALGVLLPDLLGRAGGSRFLATPAVRGRRHAVGRASEHGPLVVIMEDIHWADESTRHLLRFLAQALTDAPVMMVASYRTDELNRRHPLRPFLAEVGRLPRTVRIDVPSLGREEVGDLLTALLGRRPSHVVIDLVNRRSEGIPYFVEELAGSATRGCIDMPDTLRDALNLRVLALSEPAQSIVQLTAVAGNRVDHELLEAVADRPAAELDSALREAIDASVLVADETGYSFRHALLQEGLRRPAARPARAAARPICRDPGGAARADHQPWVGPDRGVRDRPSRAAHEVNKAFSWSIKAATSGQAAFHETLKMYERALELWDQVSEPERIAGDRASVLEDAARAAADADETERALSLIGASLAETDLTPGPG